MNIMDQRVRHHGAGKTTLDPIVAPTLTTTAPISPRQCQNETLLDFSSNLLFLCTPRTAAFGSIGLSLLHRSAPTSSGEAGLPRRLSRAHDPHHGLAPSPPSGPLCSPGSSYGLGHQGTASVVPRDRAKRGCSERYKAAGSLPAYLLPCPPCHVGQEDARYPSTH